MKMRWGIVIGLALAWAGRGETLEEAAASIGKSVTFTSEVKAVSLSPHSHATYLNFGGTYPHQVLSARIPTERQRIADDLPYLVGREVKVTGTVEATPTGPIIVINDGKQLEVQPLVVGDVLDEDGESSPYVQRIGAALHQMLDAADYDALEKVAQDWLDTKARSRSGLWKLEMFFERLSPASSSSENFFQRRFEQLSGWASARPASLLPEILLGRAWTSYAWAARGSGYANTVPDWQWKRFAKRLDEARKHLEKIRARRKENPGWFTAMQTVALGQQWSRAEYDGLFDEAVKYTPDYDPFYFKKAQWLLPRWYGKPGDWEKFALEAREDRKEDDELYARICWSLSWTRPNIFANSKVQWPLVKKGFEEMVSRYPKSQRDLSAYGWLAGMAGDKKTCSEIIARMGKHPDFEIWITWENVEAAMLWTKDPKAPVPIIFRPEEWPN